MFVHGGEQRWSDEQQVGIGPFPQGMALHCHCSCLHMLHSSSGYQRVPFYWPTASLLAYTEPATAFCKIQGQSLSTSHMERWDWYRKKQKQTRSLGGLIWDLSLKGEHYGYLSENSFFYQDFLHLSLSHLLGSGPTMAIQLFSSPSCHTESQKATLGWLKRLLCLS